ncbi:hypothetical protein PInf_029030 [Phytophthora infestans]|nr:hypothetical protein PInf_029030 [Phytophthora infestans]
MDHTAVAVAAILEGDNSTRCEACKSCGAILELDGCGHRFHPRCIFAWPATHCEVCDEPVGNVLVFRETKNSSNSNARKGKWSIDEHKYANLLMKQFKLGALPLADGLHLRVFMANMLQCDPLRVTKKYTGQAIGKQNFFYQRGKNYCYNLHVKLQKQFSNLRNHYYWHVQYRCKFGPNLNIQELKAAEADYWIGEFCISRAASVSGLVTLVPVVKLEHNTTSVEKGGEDDNAPSMKDGVSLMLGFASTMDQSPSPLGADEWNHPSASMDLTLTGLSQEELSSGDFTFKPCTQEILKKCHWMNDWMKEAELEWSKGAISWSLSLSTEPLADFA